MASFTVLAIIVSVCFILVINDTYAGNKFCVPCGNPNFGDDNVAQQEVVAEPNVEMEELAQRGEGNANPLPFLDELYDTQDSASDGVEHERDDHRSLLCTDSTVNIDQEAAQNQEYAQNQEAAQSSRIATPRYMRIGSWRYTSEQEDDNLGSNSEENPVEGSRIVTPRYMRRGSRQYTSMQRDDNLGSNSEENPVEGLRIETPRYMRRGSRQYTSMQRDDNYDNGMQLTEQPMPGGHIGTRHNQELLNLLTTEFTGEGSSKTSKERRNRKKRSGSKQNRSKQQDDN